MPELLDAPIVRTLADGNPYTFQPLGMDVLFGEFREFIKSRRRAELAEVNDNATRLDLYDRWIRDGVHLIDCLREALTVDGAEWLVWRSLRVNHPEVQRGDVLGMFARPADIIELRDELVNFPEVDAEADPPATTENLTA